MDKKRKRKNDGLSEIKTIPDKVDRVEELLMTLFPERKRGRVSQERFIAVLYIS